jgi:hypothetical protein
MAALTPSSTGSTSGTWVAGLAGAAPTAVGATDFLISEGQTTGSRFNIAGVTISDTGGNPCVAFEFLQGSMIDSSNLPIMLETVGITGAHPVDGSCECMPVTIFGMIPAAFTVGGPLSPTGGTIKVTLDSNPPDKLTYEEGGKRWSASFSKVGKGTKLLKVVPEHGNTVSIKFIIQAAPPDDNDG